MMDSSTRQARVGITVSPTPEKQHMAEPAHQAVLQTSDLIGIVEALTRKS
jgi:hypothetical protein